MYGDGCLQYGVWGNGLLGLLACKNDRWSIAVRCSLLLCLEYPPRLAEEFLLSAAAGRAQTVTVTTDTSKSPVATPKPILLHSPSSENALSTANRTRQTDTLPAAADRLWGLVDRHRNPVSPVSLSRACYSTGKALSSIDRRLNPCH